MIDLAGHHKYLKTTIFGLTGYAPDFAMLVVSANTGLGNQLFIVQLDTLKQLNTSVQRDRYMYKYNYNKYKNFHSWGTRHCSQEH